MSSTPSMPPLPGRVPWRPLSAGLLLSTGIAGAIALDFAARYKPHVLLHILAAYVILALLVVIYSLAYVTRRPFLRFTAWSAVVFLSAVLGFVHLDDMPTRMVYRNDELWPRPAAPGLYWAVGLLGFNLLLLTAHWLWLGRGARVRKEADSLHAVDEP